MQWTDDLALGEARMDETHREFADALAALTASADDQMLAALDAFIHHSEVHFTDENERMAATAFPPAHCHLGEHEGVIGICKEVRGRVAAGEYEVGRVLARELDPWFRNHLQTMDRMLAYWLNLDEAGRAEAMAQAQAAQAQAAAAAGHVHGPGCGHAEHEHEHGPGCGHAEHVHGPACDHAELDPAAHAEPQAPASHDHAAR
jgi:hemerythrin